MNNLNERDRTNLYALINDKEGCVNMLDTDIVNATDVFTDEQILSTYKAYYDERLKKMSH